MIRRPPGSPLFPYTRLCRSPCASDAWMLRSQRRREGERLAGHAAARRRGRHLDVGDERGDAVGALVRSEEHTSELQSRQYLVCRLLLEKKKSAHPTPQTTAS